MNQTDTLFIKRTDERRSWHWETREPEKEKGTSAVFFFCSHLLCVVLFLASVCLSAVSVFPLFTKKKRQILEGSVNHYPLLTPWHWETNRLPAGNTCVCVSECVCVCLSVCVCVCVCVCVRGKHVCRFMFISLLYVLTFSCMFLYSNHAARTSVHVCVSSVRLHVCVVFAQILQRLFLCVCVCVCVCVCFFHFLHVEIRAEEEQHYQTAGN